MTTAVSSIRGRTYKSVDKLKILQDLENARDNSKVLEIMTNHMIHPEEIWEWKARYNEFGLKGLRATRNWKKSVGIE